MRHIVDNIKKVSENQDKPGDNITKKDEKKKIAKLYKSDQVTFDNM